ncbi:MAG: hypothetical protein Q9162_001241 [Coniocarpon cinnabarinum]
MNGPPPAPSGAGDNKGPVVMGLVWILRPAAVIVIGLRLLTRIRFKKTAGWDDACIAMSALLTVFGMIWNTLQVHYGYGKHIYTLTPQQLSGNAKYLLLAELFNFANLFFVRTSVCFFTHRLLPPTQQWSLRLVIVAWILNLISTLANMITFAVQCRPIQGLWDPSAPAHCFGTKTLEKLFYMGTVFAIFADFIIVAVPVTIIRHVQMSRAIKVGTYIIISLSLVTASLSIGKCVVAKDIHDPYYDSVPVQMFSLFEENLGIVFASVPALRQFYLYLNNRMQSDGASRPGAYNRGASKTEEGGPPPSPGLRSNHSSGIFGKAPKYSIIRRNFETHRKLHDFAGRFSVGADSFDRGTSLKSRDSNYTGHFTAMDSIAEVPSGKTSFYRQDSTATLVNEKHPDRITKGHSPAPTGRRKEGQSASPRIATVSYDSLPANNKVPRTELSSDSPVSPESPSASNIDVSRMVVSPEPTRPHEPLPAPLRVTPVPFTSAKKSQTPVSRDETAFPISTEPSTRMPTPPAVHSHIVTQRNRRHDSREASGTTQSTTNHFDGLRSRFSLHNVLRVSRSTESLCNLGRGRSAGTSHRTSVASRESSRSTTRGRSRSVTTADSWRRADTPFIEENNNEAMEAYHQMIGTTRQEQRMAPPERPARSLVWMYPPHSVSLSEHLAYKDRRESLSPAVERVSNILQHPLLRGGSSTASYRDLSPAEVPRLSDHPMLKAQSRREESPVERPPSLHPAKRSQHATPVEEKKESTLYSRFSTSSSIYPERPGKSLPARPESLVPQVPSMPVHLARQQR